jgi:hypothetical protein
VVHAAKVVVVHAAKNPDPDPDPDPDPEPEPELGRTLFRTPCKMKMMPLSVGFCHSMASHFAPFIVSAVASRLLKVCGGSDQG